MIGVLLGSKTEGRVSGWAAVRGSTEIRVSGMSSGDMIKVHLKGDGRDDSFLWANENMILPIPKGVEYVRAEHNLVGEDPDVCVELF